MAWYFGNVKSVTVSRAYTILSWEWHGKPDSNMNVKKRLVCVWWVGGTWNLWEGGGGKGRYRELKRFEVYYMCMYEDNNETH
jgi:hypothetical protein